MPGAGGRRSQSVDRHLHAAVREVTDPFGDIAAAPNPTIGRRVRVEHWANALNQPRVAAANMLGGSEVYDRLPYFFTDQYQLGMEYLGLSTGYDDVVIENVRQTVTAIREKSARLDRDSEVRRLTRDAAARYGPLLDRLAQ